jgi:hypothetical protein
MPLVQIKGISGYLSLQQKQEIISKVTDAIVSAIAPALLYLLHDPQGCGECREMTGSFPVHAVVGRRRRFKACYLGSHEDVASGGGWWSAHYHR